MSMVSWTFNQVKRVELNVSHLREVTLSPYPAVSGEFVTILVGWVDGLLISHPDIAPEQVESCFINIKVFVQNISEMSALNYS